MAIGMAIIADIIMDIIGAITEVIKQGMLLAREIRTVMFTIIEVMVLKIRAT